MTQDTERVQRLRTCLEQALAPQALEIIDDSAAHAGHDTHAQGAGHFFIRVVSERFDGLLPIARHRLVYAAVQSLMVSDIHALSIKAFTPHEATQM